MTPISPIDQTEIEAAFNLEARVVLAEPQPDAELIVLPSRAPVIVRAEAAQTGVLPALMRETRRTYRWTASAGRIWPSDQDERPGEAVFMPPEQSACVTLTAEVLIDVARRADGGETVQVARRAELRALTPVSSQAMTSGVLDGYPIGEYLDPNAPKVKEAYGIESDWFETYPDRYAVPAWYYKITRDLKSLRISPNLTLDLWTIDFPWMSLGMPQYVALDMHLVWKLEDVLTLMRADGYAVTTFKPIYGFRPPAFNLGKIASEIDTTLKVPFSQHQYGRALDVIVDENGDNMMDDLNGDGVIDIHDASVVMHYVNILDRQYRAEGRMEMVGGAGLYTHHDFLEREQAVGQTPYIHIDTRGFLRGDGRLIRWPDKWPDDTWIQWGKI